MSKKDIFTLVIAISIIFTAIFFMMQLLNPPANNQNVQPESELVPYVPSKIDEKALKKVDDLSDYGLPSQSGIGKSDLFSGF